MRSRLLSESAKLDESMLDALGILPQRKQHKKLLLVCAAQFCHLHCQYLVIFFRCVVLSVMCDREKRKLVGEDSGEEQLFASKNCTSKDGSDGELNVYLHRLKIEVIAVQER
ncbi:hypothetical protein Tco_1247115 [Tanacetum coccineum]